MLRIILNNRKLKLIEKRVLYQTQRYSDRWEDNVSFATTVCKFLEQDTLNLNNIIRKHNKVSKFSLTIIAKPYLLNIQNDLNIILNEGRKEIPDIDRIKESVDSLSYYNFLTKLIGV